MAKTTIQIAPKQGKLSARLKKKNWKRFRKLDIRKEVQIG